MPSDTERMNWLERREIDLIGFKDGGGLDIANSPMGLRAELDAQMEQEERDAQKAG